jgi:Transposase DDE domain
MLLVVATVYQQQLSMYENKQQRVDDRIVSLTQPHIRPIVRGKAGTPVEFGAKLSVSYHIDRLAKKQAQADEKFRSRIEGKFGEAKRRFSLGRVMTKLSETSQTA